VQLHLKGIRGPTIQQAGCHHANSLAQKNNSNIEHQLSIRDTQMISIVQFIPGLVESSSQSEDSQEDQAQHVASNASQDNTELQILRLFQEIQRSFTKPNTDAQNDRCNRKQRVKTPDDGGFLRTNITKYCWTHGACGHHCTDCSDRLQALGHKKDATFDNKKGGNKAICQ